MCQNAVKTTADLLVAEEPTLKGLLEYVGLLNTPDGQAVITAFDAAVTVLQGWTSGTAAQNVLQALAGFQTVFDTLPLPATVTTLANIILAGVETVIGIVTANSPAPVATPPSATATTEEVQAHWQAHTIEQTSAKVQTLVPGFKRSIWHTAAHQYKSTWNKTVDEGRFPSSLKV